MDARQCVRFHLVGVEHLFDVRHADQRLCCCAHGLSSYAFPLGAYVMDVHRVPWSTTNLRVEQGFSPAQNSRILWRLQPLGTGLPQGLKPVKNDASFAGL